MVDGMVQALYATINKVNIKRATSSKISDYVYVWFIRYFLCRDCFCGFDCQRERVDMRKVLKCMCLTV